MAFGFVFVFPMIYFNINGLDASASESALYAFVAVVYLWVLTYGMRSIAQGNHWLTKLSALVIILTIGGVIFGILQIFFEAFLSR